jgi:hypothetical protein
LCLSRVCVRRSVGEWNLGMEELNWGDGKARTRPGVEGITPRDETVLTKCMVRSGTRGEDATVHPSGCDDLFTLFTIDSSLLRCLTVHLKKNAIGYVLKQNLMHWIVVCLPKKKTAELNKQDEHLRIKLVKKFSIWAETSDLEICLTHFSERWQADSMYSLKEIS